MNYFRSYTLFFLLFAFSLNLHAQDSVRTEKFLFDWEEPVDIYLTTDFQLLYHDRKEENYQLAGFSMRFPDGRVFNESIQVKARGVYRKEYCSMPPVMLNFKKVRDPRLRKIHNLKLVVGCDKTSYSEQLIVKEYLAYRIYNTLTDKSFQVQLARIHFIDTLNNSRNYEQLGFLIESIESLSKRVSCFPLNPGYRLTQLDREQTHIMNVFQYMIGNTDFTFHLNRNIKLIHNEYDVTSPPMPVPYDFDYSGLVNARYAIPHPDYKEKINTVKDRLYLGLPMSDPELDAIITLFTLKEQSIRELIQSQKQLSEHNKKEALDYIRVFYELINDKKQSKRVFSSPYYDGL